MVVVAGPVVVHTGGVEGLSALIRQGSVQGLLSGNALGVHDVEAALFGTSLGVRLSVTSTQPEDGAPCAGLSAALAMGTMCPWLWKLGRAMAGYEVRMNDRGVEFILGTKKIPSNLSLAWNQIAAIKHKRIGNAQQYWVQGTDGSEARYSSYTFFRPKEGRPPDRRPRRSDDPGRLPIVLA